MYARLGSSSPRRFFPLRIKSAVNGLTADVNVDLSLPTSFSSPLPTISKNAQDVASAIKHLAAAREINTLEGAPADYITSTCLVAKAYHLQGEPEKSIDAYR